MDNQEQTVLMIADNEGNSFAIPADQLDQFRVPAAGERDVEGFNMDLANEMKTAHGTGTYSTTVLYKPFALGPLVGMAFKPSVGWRR